MALQLPPPLLLPLLVLLPLPLPVSLPLVVMVAGRMAGRALPLLTMMILLLNLPRARLQALAPLVPQPRKPLPPPVRPPLRALPVNQQQQALTRMALRSAGRLPLRLPR